MGRPCKNPYKNYPEFTIWSDIKRRCFHTNREEYHRYGGRGITICQLWQYDFMAFYQYLGPRPSKRHSVNRIDNDAGYCPNNCRWADDKEQSRNKSNNKMITFDNRTQHLISWSEEIGIDYYTLFGRIHKKGWSVERAFTTLPRPIRRDLFTFNGKTQNIMDWARELNVTYQALQYRLDNGYSIEETFSIPFTSHNRQITKGVLNG